MCDTGLQMQSMLSRWQLLFSKLENHAMKDIQDRQRSWVSTWRRVAVIVIAIGVPTYVWLNEVLPALATKSARHLQPDEKARMAVALRLSPAERYAFQINCIPDCTECESFAEELRDFFNTAPGWTVSGSSLLSTDARWQRGLYLITRNDEQHIAPVEKVMAAFSTVGIALTLSTDDFRQGTFVIVVGK